MPKRLPSTAAARAARRKHLTGERRKAYIGGTIDRAEHKNKRPPKRRKR